MNRIDARFRELKHAGRKAFIPYLTAGDPDLDATLALMLEMERGGADIIELGVPFSDPMADGPVIQRASERALARGVSARDCLALVGKLRGRSQVPVVLFSYLNPLLAIGIDRLPELLAGCGVDGVLITDLVPEEAGEYTGGLVAAGIDPIFLVAPTSTDDRIRLIVEASRGFVYAVSRTGVTGVRETVSEAAARLAGRVRRITETPVAVGFGISTPEQVAETWQYADGAVVGSRIVAEIEANARDPELVERVGRMVRWLVSPRDAAHSRP